MAFPSYRLIRIALATMAMMPTASSTVRILGRHNVGPEETNVTSGLPASPTDGCQSDDAGFFGRIGVTQLLEFNYEVETTPAESGDVTGIITVLEQAVVNKVLPMLFSDLCGRRRDVRFVPRRLETVGVSLNPPDQVLDLTCSTEFNASNACAVVDGLMTVYTSDGSFGLDNEVLALIKQSMNRGELNDVHPAVVNVSYVDIIPDPVENGSIKDPAKKDEKDGRGAGTPVYIAIAIGALIIAGAAIIWRRRQNKANDSDVSALNEGSAEPPVGSAGLDFSPLEGTQ